MKKTHRMWHLWFVARMTLIGFSLMAVFSVYLHDHDFDPAHLDEDCAPCHWSHISLNSEEPVPELDIALTVIAYRLPPEPVSVPLFRAPHRGRGPPAPIHQSV